MLPDTRDVAFTQHLERPYLKAAQAHLLTDTICPKCRPGKPEKDISRKLYSWTIRPARV